MKLREVGERETISRLAEIFGECGYCGIGEDCGVFECEGLSVVSTDVIRRSTHIPREMNLFQAGWYAVNASLSDIASMGAVPRYILLYLGLPVDMELEEVLEIARGIQKACEFHGICVIGGDTKSHKELTIGVTSIGMAERVMLRRGAMPGDIICTTGELGGAAAAFYALIHGVEVPPELLKKAFEPVARVREGRIIAKYASSCIDISDGLAYSLYELSRQSGVGFEVFMEDIPVSEWVREISRATGEDEKEMVFHKGGDFELLFTISPENLKKLKEELTVYPIGRVTQTGHELVTSTGREPLNPRGYDAFRGF